MNIKKIYWRFQKFVSDYSQLNWWKHYSVGQLNAAKANFEHWKKLSKDQKREITAFWNLKNPNSTDFITHEVMMNVKGEFDVKYCPESTFRINLDDNFVYRTWTDKNYFDRFQPGIPFPHIYVRNINGVFSDHDYHLISKEEAEKIIKEHLPLIIKPSIDSGEGKNLKLISNEKEADEIFSHYTKDYLLQELIVPCDELKKLSPHSVASARVITAMINGKPVVLKKHLLCNTTDSIAVNAVAAPGAGVVIIPISEDGILADTGYYENTKALQTLPSGITFGGMQIPSFKEALKLAVEAHGSMPMLDFAGWDITIDENNQPVFIEWNQKGTEIYHTQLSQGPLFGEYTEYYTDKLKEMKNRHK